MADTRNKAASGDEAKRDGAAESEEEPVFSVEALVEQSRRLFGVSPHIAAGALSKGGRKNYTEAEAKTRVEQFASMELDS